MEPTFSVDLRYVVARKLPVVCFILCGTICGRGCDSFTTFTDFTARFFLQSMSDTF